jgi:hypothetical protein
MLGNSELLPSRPVWGIQVARARYIADLCKKSSQELFENDWGNIFKKKLKNKLNIFKFQRAFAINIALRYFFSKMS